MPDTAREVVAATPDVIFAFSSRMVQQLEKTTTSIPVVGYPWRAQADRRRLRDAPVGFAGALAADRGHPALGRSINEVSHGRSRLKLCLAKPRLVARPLPTLLLE